MRQTKMANGKDIQKNWYVVDATNLILGRMSTEVARILTGKHKPTYTPHEDNGDFVVIINASKVKLTGNKMSGKANSKLYYNHSGFPGGMRIRTAKTMSEKYPIEMVYESIKGMIPHNKLGRKQVKKLFIYANNDHKHEAQQPISYEIVGNKA